jgi:hypothetical protein
MSEDDDIVFPDDFRYRCDAHVKEIEGTSILYFWRIFRDHWGRSLETSLWGHEEWIEIIAIQEDRAESAYRKAIAHLKEQDLFESCKQLAAFYKFCRRIAAMETSAVERIAA